jgi:uncharacterized protein
LALGTTPGETRVSPPTAADVARQLGYVDIALELAARSGAIPSVRQTLRQPAQPAE